MSEAKYAYKDKLLNNFFSVIPHKLEKIVYNVQKTLFDYEACEIHDP